MSSSEDPAAPPIARGLVELSRGEMGSVVTMGLAAAMAASLYKVGEIMIQHRSEGDGDLCIETDMLQENRSLYSLFVQLQEYRYIHQVAFNRAVNEADRMVTHTRTVESITDVSTDDGRFSYAYMGACKDALRELAKTATGNERVSAKHAVKVRKISRDIASILREMYRKVDDKVRARFPPLRRGRKGR